MSVCIFCSFWQFASPFCKNICIFLAKMVINVNTNLHSSPELSSNSHFCSIVKNMQNSLKLGKFLSAFAAPFFKISKKLFAKSFYFYLYFNISRPELRRKEIFMPPNHANKPLQIRHFNAPIPISIFKAAPIFNFLVLPFSVFGQPFRHKVHQIEGWLFQAIIVKYKS